MHFIPLTAREQAIGSNEQLVSLAPRETSGERAACLPRRRQGERGPAAPSAGHVFSVGSARASRAAFGALAEHTVRPAGRRPVQPRRLRSPTLNTDSAGGEGAAATRHEHRQHHRARLFLAGALIISCVQIAIAADRVQNASSSQTNHHAGRQEMELQGKVVCLPEEMHRVYQTDLPTNHEHLYGFKTTNGIYYTLLRTKLSEALFADQRVREKELLLTGTVLPKSQIIDVTAMKSIRNGVVYDLYYYCDICAIRTVAPGPCVCCQAPVELVEKPLEPAKR